MPQLNTHKTQPPPTSTSSTPAVPHRSIRRARRLTAVTATPACNNLLFSMRCTDDDPPAAAAPAADGLRPGASATAVAAAEISTAGVMAGGHNQPLSLVPGGVSHGRSDGNAGGSDDSIADTARRWWQTRSSSGGGGDDSGTVRVVSQMDLGGTDDEEEGGEGEDEDEDWWAGEEFEEDFLCLFEAYCPEGGGGRMPCLVAREVGFRRTLGGVFSRFRGAPWFALFVRSQLVSIAVSIRALFFMFYKSFFSIL